MRDQIRSDVGDVTEPAGRRVERVLTRFPRERVSDPTRRRLAAFAADFDGVLRTDARTGELYVDESAVRAVVAKHAPQANPRILDDLLAHAKAQPGAPIRARAAAGDAPSTLAAAAPRLGIRRPPSEGEDWALPATATDSEIAAFVRRRVPQCPESLLDPARLASAAGQLVTTDGKAAAKTVDLDAFGRCFGGMTILLWAVFIPAIGAFVALTIASGGAALGAFALWQVLVTAAIGWGIGLGAGAILTAFACLLASIR